MRFDYNDIKKDLLENWEVITDSQYPEDALGEFADGYLPTYYVDIIDDWRVMPSEFDNTWHEYGIPSSDISEVSITGLMTIDLYNYYRQETERAYKDILRDKENEDENAE
jgi:hypothetical protein